MQLVDVNIQNEVVLRSDKQEVFEDKNKVSVCVFVFEQETLLFV